MIISRKSLMLSNDNPDKIGTNRSSVITIKPIIIYKAYCVTIPVSNFAIFWLPPYKVLVNPKGPNNSITPRSRILAVVFPIPKALLMM